jgi:hypothetical protein
MNLKYLLSALPITQGKVFKATLERTAMVCVEG